MINKGLMPLPRAIMWRSSSWPAIGFLVSVAYSGPTLADCSPAAANDVNATCTGTTTTQFGDGAQTNVTVTIVPGATVAVTAATAYSVYVASVTAYNYGTITATGSIAAAGVYANTGAATVTNSGAITAAVTGSGLAFGVYGGTTATVTNSGAITAAVTGSGEAFGVQAYAASSLVNTGTISAVSVGGTAYAISFGNQADTVTLGAGSKLIGGLDLGGGADKISFIGGNHNLTFASGNLTSAIFTGSSIPYAVSGNRAAAIDPTSFAANTTMLQSTTRVISSLAPDFMAARNDEKPLTVLSYAPGPVEFKLPEGARAHVADAPLKSQTTVTADGTGIWTRFFGGQSYDKAEGNLVGFRNTYYGGAIGVDRPVDANLRYGAFLGGLSGASKLALNYGGTDSQMGFVGVYTRYASGASFVKVGLQAGYGNNASTRRTNNNLLASGVETATSNSNTWYVSPELSAGHIFDLGRFLNGDVSLTPTGQVRYLYGSFGSYLEAGGTDNLRMGGRTVQSVEERLTFKLSHVSTQPSGLRLKLDLIGGVLGAQRLSGGALTGTLLGQSIQFSEPGKASRNAATAGLGAELSNGLTSVYVAGEYIAQPNGVSDYSGRAGVSIRF